MLPDCGLPGGPSRGPSQSPTPAASARGAPRAPASLPAGRARSPPRPSEGRVRPSPTASALADVSRATRRRAPGGAASGSSGRATAPRVEPAAGGTPANRSQRAPPAAFAPLASAADAPRQRNASERRAGARAALRRRDLRPSGEWLAGVAWMTPFSASAPRARSMSGRVSHATGAVPRRRRGAHWNGSRDFALGCAGWMGGRDERGSGQSRRGRRSSAEVPDCRMDTAQRAHPPTDL